jgi:hypothetical protein
MKLFVKSKLSFKMLIFIIAIVGISAISYAFVLCETPIINVTIPNTFTTGTTISSSAVNENFTALANQMPGVDWATISQTNITPSSTTTLASVNINAPCAGYVVVRFDGMANEDSGKQVILAASNTTSWGVNDGNVNFQGDSYMHPFSHTRVYSVSKGCDNTFYAVVQSTGTTSIYGTLTATFYPNGY